MWLINTTTLKLREFMGDVLPKYAILSHRWHDTEEISFQEIQSDESQIQQRMKQKVGFKKVKEAAARAKEDDRCGWLWVDTCSIDKKSSAELTEAINSMFEWYSRSHVCYAYLTDVGEEMDIDRSVWFTRGFVPLKLEISRRTYLNLDGLYKNSSLQKRLFSTRGRGAKSAPNSVWQKRSAK